MSGADALPTDRQPTLRVKTRPNDANEARDIFGGWLMSEIDVAGAIVAIGRAQGAVATVAVKELAIKKPLFVYDLVSFYATLTAVGTTSLTVKVEVYAQRYPQYRDAFQVAEATMVYVAVSEPGQKRRVLS